LSWLTGSGDAQLLRQQPRLLARRLEGMLWQVLARELQRGRQGGFVPGGMAGSVFGDMLGQVLADQAATASDLGLAGALSRQLGLPDGAARTGGAPIWPLAGKITSRFGMRRDPFTGQQRFHRGLDIAASSGTPISSVGPGRVVYAGTAGRLGLTVVVRQADGTSVTYGHCRRLLVGNGQRVAAGQPLAEVGQSGRATGPHLHLEVHREGRAVDPLDFLSGRLSGVKIPASVSMIGLGREPGGEPPGGET